MSTLELLLDLVFVVTVAQLARSIAEDPGVQSAGRAALVVVVVWWLYDAFAWLTNESAPETPLTRVLLVAAMAGFLVLSLAIPDALAGSSAVFGVAYVVVAVIHGGMFVALGGASSAALMWRVMPINIAIGASFVAIGATDGTARVAFELLPVALIVVAMGISRRTAFDLSPEHFVERHGLLMIIALGESIVSVAAGAPERGVAGPTIVGAVLVVGLVAALWWCYFGDDPERARAAFGHVTPAQRTTAALRAFYLDHLVMLFGLVLLGAGLHLALEDPFAAPGATAGLLVGSGTALFLVGGADYRRYLGLGTWWVRPLAAVACVGFGALAGSVTTVALLLGTGIIVVAAIGLELRVDRVRSA